MFHLNILFHPEIKSDFTFHVSRQSALPELQHSCRIEGRIDPPHKVKVTHKQVAFSVTGEGYRCQQLVALRHPTAAWAGDAPPPPVPHDAINDGGLLLGQEDVLPTALV